MLKKGTSASVRWEVSGSLLAKRHDQGRRKQPQKRKHHQEPGLMHPLHVKENSEHRQINDQRLRNPPSNIRTKNRMKTETGRPARP